VRPALDGSASCAFGRQWWIELVRKVNGYLIVACIAVFFSGGCTMVGNTSLDDPERLYSLKIIKLEHDSEYVIDLPFYIAVTITPRIEGSYFSLPAADFLSLGGCIGLNLDPTGDSGSSINFIPPAPIIDPEEPHGDTFDLAEGEQRRMLVDLSPLLPPGLQPGTYDLKVFYIAPGSVVQSQPVRVTFRSPSDEDWRRKSRLSPDRDRYRTWAEWIKSDPHSPSSLTTLVDQNDPLRFAILLRYLLHSQIPLEKLDPQILSPLTGLFAPEAMAFRAELLRAKNDKANLASVLQQIQIKYPGLLWWVRSIRDGSGQLEWRRSR
jgi:hypothetical protein